jgi:3-dehydroquinate synthase
MLKINVALGPKSYPIYISKDLLDLKQQLMTIIDQREVAIISSKKIAALHIKKIHKMIGAKRFRLIIVPDGEGAKSLLTFEKIIDQLIDLKIKRDGILIALGGGVIGDLTGFTAACYQRGIDFIQIPTTLLAQVDSSVGGKTGVNHPQAKNMIGAFHQPIAVLTSIGCLDTLPKRQFNAGMAEIIKYGAVQDKRFFNYLLKNIKPIKQLNEPELTYIIKKSCHIKATIVEEDEKEKGKRALLNFGHTFGHAIEYIHGYKGILHGEAVANGMLIAAIISHKLDFLTNKEVIQIREMLASYGLDKFKRRYDVSQLIDAILLDKKNTYNQIRIILLNKIGGAFTYSVNNKKELNFLLKHALQQL